MVFNPIYPFLSLSGFTSGCVMVFAALAVIFKVHYGSKNKFAYTLMFFTAWLGTAWIGLSSTKAFRREVVMPDGTTKYFINYYISSLFFYARMISATQAWIFAIRYWLSATVI